MNHYWKKLKDIIKKNRELQQIGVANVGGKAISGLLWFFIATLMEPDVYGQISYLIAIAIMASRISLFGSGQTIVVYTAKKIAIQPPVIVLVLILSSISSVVLFFIFEDIAVSLYVFSIAIYDLAIAGLLGRNLYKNYAQYFIVQKIFSVIFGLILYYFFGPSGLILGIGISFLLLLPRIINALKSEKLDFSLLKPRFGFMLNNYGLTIEKIFAGQIDKIIIASLFGFAIVGNYHLGFQFLGVLLIVPAIVFTYILPRDASGIPSLKLKKITILVSIGFAILGIVLAPIVLPTIFPKFIEAAEIVQIMSLYIIPNSINIVYMSHFLGNEKSKIVLIGQSISITTYLVGILTLGDLYGINGVAISLVLSGIFQAIFFVFAKKYYAKSIKN